MSVPVAVLEHVGEIGDVARVGRQRFRLARVITGLEDFEKLARRLPAGQLWIHPSWTRAHPEVQLCEACATATRGPKHTHWLHLDGPTVALVAGDRNLPREFGATRDGGELLALVERTSKFLLGEPWHGTAGATGVALLRGSLRRAGHELIPLPDELRRLAGVEPDYGWQRPLTEAERGRRWVWCFDKHNMYLTAAQSVQLGVGEVEFKAEPAFTARQPGYWHVQLAPWPAEHPLPDPTRGAGPPRDPAAFRWLTTPSVEAAIAAGRLEAISAVWYWPVHGSFLQATANLLRRAIERVGAEDPLRGVLKSVYAELLSGYLARSALSGSADPLYRPDWRDHLKAEARCRLWYGLRALAAAGCAPFAIATDALYIASDAERPEDVLAGVLRLGARPAQFALKSRVALADLPEAHIDRVGSCRGLVSAVRALEHV